MKSILFPHSTDTLNKFSSFIWFDSCSVVGVTASFYQSGGGKMEFSVLEHRNLQKKIKIKDSTVNSQSAVTIAITVIHQK